MSAGAVLLLCAGASAAENVIWDDRPGDSWERTWYPLGNGRLGCMVDGGTNRFRVQFNVDSLWTGDENLTGDVGDDRADANYSNMGAYQNFGELEISFAGLPADVASYRRELSLSSATYADSFVAGDVKIRRRVFASAPDDAIFIVIDAPTGQTEMKLSGAHGEKESHGGANRPVSLSGRLGNGLEYAARADMFRDRSGNLAVVVLRATTSIGAIPPAEDCVGAKGVCGIRSILGRHVAEYRGYYDRMTFELGESDRSVPTRERIACVRGGMKDLFGIILLAAGQGGNIRG